MEFIKQRVSLPVEDVENVLTTDADRKETNRRRRRHGDLLPDSIRCIICGPSGSGKTNAMLSLLYNKNGLCFENVYVYSKSLYQPKYRMLEKILRSIKGIGYYSYNENADIVAPSEAKPHSVFIFDDVVSGKQEKIREYFSFARHNNLDSFFLIQSYTHAGKQLIRDNCNMLIIFKQDDLNLDHVYKNHIGGDMSFAEFKEMAAHCWNGSANGHGFLTICKDFGMNDGRYRKNFDQYIRIKK